MNNFVRTVLSCFCVCFFIFSCSDSELEEKNLSLGETALAENPSDKKAYITISLGDSLSAERTVMPTALNKNDLMYELWGQQNGESVSRKLATWVSYDKLKEKRVIDIAVGEWTFTLKAFMDSNTQILTDTISKSISYGLNTLSFNMKEVPGTGSIDVLFWYPKFEGGCVKAELNSLSNYNSETNVYAKTQLEISAKEKIIDGNTYSSVAYKKENVESGCYILNFYIYEHSSDTNPKNCYSTLVKVSHGSVSSGTEMLGEGNYVTIFRTASGIVWNSASYAKKYRVYKYETEDYINPKTFDTALFTSEPYETESAEYEIENALCGKNIYVAVKAWSEKRESDFSNVICIETNTYPIKYELGEDAENIENPNPESYSMADGLVLQDASRVGYVFGGWYEDAGFTGEKVTKIAKGSRKKRTLYAKWEAAKYTIVFDANASDATGTVTSVTASYGESLNLPANIFTRTGYTFKGWAKNSGAASADYAAGASVKDLSSTDGATVTLYAVWQANTALFSVTLESVTTTSVLSITVSGLTLSASEGYKSYRWLVDGIEQTGNTSSIFALSSTLNGGWHNITLVATDSEGNIDSATAVVTIQK